jgi:hypothetical protein
VASWNTNLRLRGDVKLQAGEGRRVAGIRGRRNQNLACKREKKGSEPTWRTDVVCSERMVPRASSVTGSALTRTSLAPTSSLVNTKRADWSRRAFLHESLSVRPVACAK